MDDGDRTALYCLAVLRMTPEEAAATAWPDDPAEGRELRRLWLADRWAEVCRKFPLEVVAASLRQAIH